MPKKKISRTAYLEGRELLKRLRVRFPVLFPADRRDLKPWAVGEDARMRQALADAEDGETVSTEVWRAAVGRWFNGDLKRRVAYLKCLIAGAPRAARCAQACRNWALRSRRVRQRRLRDGNAEQAGAASG